MSLESEPTPPHSAGSASNSGPPNRKKTASSSSSQRQARYTTIEERASRYIEKKDDAVEGQGGDMNFFKAACALICGFSLSIDQARPILRDFNARKCVPPFSDFDIEAKMRSASKRSGQRGYLLNDGKIYTPAARLTQPDTKAPEVPKESPSLALGERYEQIISGKRYAVKWPWHYLTSMTKALQPGTVTILSAPRGTSKSLFIMDAALHWLEVPYSFSILELEGDREFHTMRALAILTGDSNAVDPDWVLVNPEKIREYWTAHARTIDRLGRAIYETDTGIGTDGVLDHIRDRAKAKDRIIIIDPITAKDSQEAPWIDARRFIRGVQGILRTADSSLILVGHPPPMQHNAKMGVDTTVMEGGRAYEKLADTVLFLKASKQPETKSCVTPMGHSDYEINRTLYLSKARLAKGQYYTLGYFFDHANLRHTERGIIQED